MDHQEKNSLNLIVYKIIYLRSFEASVIGLPLLKQTAMSRTTNRLNAVLIILKIQN